MAPNNSNDIIEVVGMVDYRFEDNPAAEEATLAICTVVIGGHFTIKNMRVVRTSGGLRVKFPTLTLPDADGEMHDVKIFQPATQRGRRAVVQAVMDAFNAEKK